MDVPLKEQELLEVDEQLLLQTGLTSLLLTTTAPGLANLSTPATILLKPPVKITSQQPQHHPQIYVKPAMMKTSHHYFRSNKDYTVGSSIGDKSSRRTSLAPPTSAASSSVPALKDISTTATTATTATTTDVEATPPPVTATTAVTTEEEGGGGREILSKKQQIQIINSTFENAELTRKNQGELRHPRKKNLKAVSVMPLLPDLASWNYTVTNSAAAGLILCSFDEQVFA